MLQIDHIYEFFYNSIFKENYTMYTCPGGVVSTDMISINNINIFTPSESTTAKIFFYDQEPLVPGLTNKYLDIFNFPSGYSIESLIQMNNTNTLPFNIQQQSDEHINTMVANHDMLYKRTKTLVVSEHSTLVNQYAEQYGFNIMYYFFHGFAALDWYRGFYALNYNKKVNKEYKYDFVSFNRLVSNDRSYRCYFVSLLTEKNLLKNGRVSFGLDTEHNSWVKEMQEVETNMCESARSHILENLTTEPLIIDSATVPGSASADIPRCIDDSLWHIVTETVFYYNKLHLTEKIFKPIVMKQPFMLIGAIGNLAYLKSYGFKTFDGIIDESYDTIVDNDARIEAVVAQIEWYCNLSNEEKQKIISQIEEIVEYNFQWFYTGFKDKIINELLTNCQKVNSTVDYNQLKIALST